MFLFVCGLALYGAWSLSRDIAESIPFCKAWHWLSVKRGRAKAPPFDPDLYWEDAIMLATAWQIDGVPEGEISRRFDEMRKAVQS